ncbi:MAG: sugar ABC transporter permease, partial [Chloroflexi bacterium]|nr:sugar ABC transporter permease [Chloroflexota bacterium]
MRPRRTRGPGHRERWFYLLVAPWLAGFVLFQAGPILTAGTLAFASWRPPLPIEWTGLDNFRAML